MRFALGMLWSCAFLSARAGNLSVEFLHSGHAADIVEQWQCQQPHSHTAGTQQARRATRRGRHQQPSTYAGIRCLCKTISRNVRTLRRLSHAESLQFQALLHKVLLLLLLLPSARMWLKVFKLRMNAQQQQKFANIFLVTCSCCSFESALLLPHCTRCLSRYPFGYTFHIRSSN